MSEPFWTPLGPGPPVDYIGVYDPAVQYAPGAVVVYQGVTYLAVNPSLGSTPPAAFTPALIATSVAGLGAGADGKIGVLRCGSGAGGHTLPVVYDATLGKWVSDIFSESTGQSRSSGQGALPGAYADNQHLPGSQIPWRIFDAAGLKPQLRFLGAGVSTGGTAFYRLGYNAADAGAAFGATVAVPATEINFPTSAVTRDSGWQDIPAGWVVRDMFRLMQQWFNNGGGGGTIDVPSAYQRWVSQ